MLMDIFFYKKADSLIVLPNRASRMGRYDKTFSLSRHFVLNCETQRRAIYLCM